MSDSTMSERIAEEVRVTLARRRISASELARRMGVTQPYISRRLTGDITIDVDDLAAMASALEVSVTDLLPAPARSEGGRAADKAYSAVQADRAACRSSGRLMRPHPHGAGSDPDVPQPSAHPAPRPRSGRRPAIQPWTHDGVAA